MKIPSIKSNFLLINVLFSIGCMAPALLTAQSTGTNQSFAYAPPNELAYTRPANARLNDIPSIAYRHFAKNFPQAEQTIWSKLSGGYQVRFNASGILNQANYDRHGNFLHGIRYLEAGQIDGQILKRLKREFPGFDPDIVSEVNNESRTVYVITLKSAFSMKSVILREGVFQVIDDLDYAGL
jgi:hypothetical protein